MNNINQGEGVGQFFDFENSSMLQAGLVAAGIVSVGAAVDFGRSRFGTRGADAHLNGLSATFL